MTIKPEENRKYHRKYSNNFAVDCTFLFTFRCFTSKLRGHTRSSFNTPHKLTESLWDYAEEWNEKPYNCIIVFQRTVYIIIVKKKVLIRHNLINAWNFEWSFSIIYRNRFFLLKKYNWWLLVLIWCVTKWTILFKCRIKPTTN